MVHNDIIPSNLLIHEDNFLKLSNFQYACIIDETEFVSLNSSNITGKVLPPEAFVVDSYCGKAADLWYCGYCLFFMIFKKNYNIDSG